MLRKLILSTCLGLSLFGLGCGDPPKPVAPTPLPVVPLPPPKDTKTLMGEGWKIEVPKSMEVQMRGDDNLLFVGHDDTDRLFALIREGVNDSSLSDLASVAKSKFTGSGFEVTGESKGTINGVPFVYFTGTRPASLSRPVPIAAHNWVLLKNQKVYFFACGGKLADAANHVTVCTKTASSLVLN